MALYLVLFIALNYWQVRREEQLNGLVAQLGSKMVDEPGILEPIEIRVPPGMLAPPNLSGDEGALPAVAGGNVETSSRVADLVPEVKDTAYRGATLRHLLDMRAGIRFNEDYLATSGPIVEYRKATGWNPLAPGDKPAPVLASLRWPGRPDLSAGNPAWTYMIEHPQYRFAVFVGHVENGAPHPFEVWVNGSEQPRGLGALAKTLSMDMRADDHPWLMLKLEALAKSGGDDAFDARDVWSLSQALFRDDAFGRTETRQRYLRGDVEALRRRQHAALLEFRRDFVSRHSDHK